MTHSYDPRHFTFVEIVKDDLINLNRFANMFIAYVQELYGVDHVPVHSWDRVHRILRDVSDGEHRMFVAYDDADVICGFGGISNRGELTPAWIAPTHRRRGLHGQLIDLRVAHGGWFTSIRHGNTASERSMIKRGFVLANEGLTSNRYALLHAMDHPETLDARPLPQEDHVINTTELQELIDEEKESGCE